MIIVGIVYIGNAPQPAPADAGVVRQRATDRVGRGRPARRQCRRRADEARPVVLRRSGARSRAPTSVPTAVTHDRRPPRPATTRATVRAHESPPADHRRHDHGGADAPRRPHWSSITLTGSAPLLGGARRHDRRPARATPRPRSYGHNDAGIASWFNAPDNTCAHRTLPFGTMVTGHPGRHRRGDVLQGRTTGARRWRPAASSTCRWTPSPSWPRPTPASSTSPSSGRAVRGDSPSGRPSDACSGRSGTRLGDSRA